MTRRILNALRTLVTELPTDSAVHFHFDGLNGETSVCHNARCDRPAADVR